LIATAYHRNTPTRNDEEEFRIEAVMDRVANTWEVWQGQTISCARCHSHTYDPFRQSDFYKLTAFFNNTEDADNKGNRPQPGIPKGRAIEWPVYYDFAAPDAARGAALVAQRDAIRLELLAARERPDVVASRNEWETAHRKFRMDKPGFDTAAFPYMTDIALLPRWGKPLLYGPGSILVAHTDDEYIEVAHLERAVTDYVGLARTLLA